MARSFAGDIEFSKLAAGGQADLVGLMFEIARDAYPQLDADGCLAELRRLQANARGRLQRGERGATLEERLLAISEFLYASEGFHGNREEYYDPRNSYLNDVLARRTGIPITLGIVYMTVAAAAGIAIFGVPTPGHFMLGAVQNGQRWYVDPFSQGEVLDEAACRLRVEEMTGQAGSAANMPLEPASTLSIVVRVLRNLKAAYAMEDQWPSALPVQERIVALLPDKADEERDLALIYLRSGQPHPALQLLTHYVAHCDEETARAIEPYLKTARRLAAELN